MLTAFSSEPDITLDNGKLVTSKTDKSLSFKGSILTEKDNK